MVGLGWGDQVGLSSDSGVRGGRWRLGHDVQVRRERHPASSLPQRHRDENHQQAGTTAVSGTNVYL